MNNTPLKTNAKTIEPLPELMVAPTGARRSRVDHAALPITTTEITTTAKACWDQGATGIHVHVRDDDEKHILDGDRYKEVIAAIQSTIPGMYIQVTTEAVGQYTITKLKRIANFCRGATPQE